MIANTIMAEAARIKQAAYAIDRAVAAGGWSEPGSMSHMDLQEAERALKASLVEVQKRRKALTRGHLHAA